jgi:predicted nucleic acid-binding protein
MILFDTDTLTHFSYGKENVKKKIEEVGDEQLGITVITRIEVLRGRAASLMTAANEEELRKAAESLRRAEELLSAFVVVDFDEDAIKHFERLRKQRNLKKMGRADMLIACIALANNALLVTRNTRDYKNVPGLRIENWVD